MVLNFNMDIDVLFEDFNREDTVSVLRVYAQVSCLLNVIAEKKEFLESILMTDLKARMWDQLTDEENKITLSITKEIKEKINKKTLKILLNDEQYNQVINKESVEKLLLVTPKERERLKKYVRKK